MLSISYSSIADLHALAQEFPAEKVALEQLATDLEQTGVGGYAGEEYIYRQSAYGMEIVSVTDVQSEDSDDDDVEDALDFLRNREVGMRW